MPRFVLRGLLAWIAVGCATLSPLPEPPTGVRLDTALHFSTPDGADLRIPAGRYDVAPEAGRHLRLTPVGAGGVHKAWSIAAAPITVPFEPPMSSAVAVSDEVDQQHVVWVGPDGNGLEAIGSPAGVITRAPCHDACRAKVFTSVTNALKTRHDTAKNSVR